MEAIRELEVLGLLELIDEQHDQIRTDKECHIAEMLRSIPPGVKQESADLLCTVTPWCSCWSSVRSGMARSSWTSSGGPLAGLNTPGLASALGAIHNQPHLPWAVEGLAGLAGISRSALFLKFLETVGDSPLRYLRHVRMRLAPRLLRETRLGIKEIAHQVGYANEASFGKAFVLFSGKFPGEFRNLCRTEAE